MAELTVKERVRKWLARQGKDGQTQRWLAEQLGITEAHLSFILDGERTPSLQVASRLEELTGIPARDFADVA